MSRKANRLKNRLHIEKQRLHFFVQRNYYATLEKSEEIAKLKSEVARLKEEIRTSHITLAMNVFPPTGIAHLRMTAMTYDDYGYLQPTMVEHAIDRNASRLLAADVPEMLAGELARKLATFMAKHGLHFESRSKR